jgi:hypothetical protein
MGFGWFQAEVTQAHAHLILDELYIVVAAVKITAHNLFDSDFVSEEPTG